MWSNGTRKALLVGAIFGLVAAGCGDDDGSGASCSVAPDPNAPGPIITFLGLARADDKLIAPDPVSVDGVPVYLRSSPGSGFRIVVEGKRGANGRAVGQSSFDPTGSGFPDLQLQVSRALGDGSAVVCDDPQVMPDLTPGGVPATEPSCFEETNTVVAAVNDFACRFQDGAGSPIARTVSEESCVLPDESGLYFFVSPESEAQYCGQISLPLAFPVGDTTVTVRLRDVGGSVGPERKVIIRVEPPPAVP